MISLVLQMALKTMGIVQESQCILKLLGEYFGGWNEKKRIQFKNGIKIEIVNRAEAIKLCKKEGNCQRSVEILK